MELSLLTYNTKHLATICAILSKRLSAFVTKKELKRSNTTKPLEYTGNISSSKMKRSSSLPVISDHSEKNDVVLLKTLTVILYLVQNGSYDFVNWVRGNIDNYIFPLSTVAPVYGKHYDAIASKVAKLLLLFTDSEQLKAFRVNIHILRSDMTTPGVKRTSIDLPSNITTEEMEVDHNIYSKRAKSMDINRNTNNTLTTLVEETFENGQLFNVTADPYIRNSRLDYQLGSGSDRYDNSGRPKPAYAIDLYIPMGTTDSSNLNYEVVDKDTVFI